MKIDHMKRKIELLAPGGDIDSIKAAIAAGADAVYCGLNRFNARNRAANINFEELTGILKLAHENGCRIFLTLNILIVGSEIPALIKLLNKLINTSIDGVIVQDLGLFYLLSRYFKGLKIHASTQLNTHNEGQIKFLGKLDTIRVNLPRELNISEIKALTLAGKKNNIATEVFVHGSYCISFSGICYMSSVHGGNSGNRGRCSQPCRDRYLTTPEGKNFPLNLKDNSAYFDLDKLSDAGVFSLKIEGRIKKFDYVYTVVNCWKKQLDGFYAQNSLSCDNSELYSVFNRDFSDGYLRGDINKDMFIDNPRDHSIKQFAGIDKRFSNGKQGKDGKPGKEKKDYYEKKGDIINSVRRRIQNFNIEKQPLIITVSGQINTPLNLCVKTPDTSFTISSKSNLTRANKKSMVKCLTYNFLLERLGALNDTAYYIEYLGLENLQKDLFLSFSELTLIKKDLFSLLNDSIQVDPIEVPFLTKPPPLKTRPDLGVLLSSQEDLHLCEKISADIFFQLPNGIKNELFGLKELFSDRPELTPWFPSVLIGKDYGAAVEFLEQVKPERIVTNNTGIAHVACKAGIPWIAGPFLNMVNSFGLLCLKEKFNCSGSFISNEISKYQIKSIIPPENFNLYYSIYHPILLLSTRQCLFHQVTGCEKNAVDGDCIQSCNKFSSITNLKKASLYIEKTKGNYPCIYNSHNFLNMEIVRDLPGIFKGFFIDLRRIKTETKINMDKSGIIKLFENQIANIKKVSKKIVKQFS